MLGWADFSLFWHGEWNRFWGRFPDAFAFWDEKSKKSKKSSLSPLTVRIGWLLCLPA
jgi:hypothetical protein